MTLAAALCRVCFAAAALLAARAGTAQAQTADFDEHGKPSLFPLQASWWAVQTGAAAPLSGNTPGKGRPVVKRVEPAKPNPRVTRACMADAAPRADKGSKTGSTPCPAAK